jgi:decaprenylphospho-beta-D-erythro-pentofuranosid-2-ulose 2-reductase
MLKILVLGATSAIAHETCRNFAVDGAEFFLVGRDTRKLDIVKDDLLVRGAKRVDCAAQDLGDLDAHPALIENAVQALNGLDAVLIAHGTLGDQEAAEASVEVTLKELNTNFTSTVSLLTLLANHFEKQRRGVIAVISSVAGDRGRGSNYVYGTAMGAKSIFLQGLRNRLAKSGVSVLTIKPGFVDTPMTANLKKNPLYADPANVGLRIYKGMKKGEDVIYVPFFWQYIMLIIRNIPEFVFKRLSL